MFPLLFPHRAPRIALPARRFFPFLASTSARTSIATVAYLVIMPITASIRIAVLGVVASSMSSRFCGLPTTSRSRKEDARRVG